MKNKQTSTQVDRMQIYPSRVSDTYNIKVLIRLRESWMLQCRMVAKQKLQRKLLSLDENHSRLHGLYAVCQVPLSFYSPWRPWFTFEKSFWIIFHFHPKDFLVWLCNRLFESLHLDATFGKRNLCLTILTTVLDVFTNKCHNDDCTHGLLSFIHLDLFLWLVRIILNGKLFSSSDAYIMRLFSLCLYI